LISRAVTRSAHRTGFVGILIPSAALPGAHTLALFPSDMRGVKLLKSEEYSPANA
jgi:hypothetical protein